MKTEIPKCIKCNKVMRTIYTKRTYKHNNKYKTFWSKEGYICNHLYTPYVILIPHKDFKNYLVDIYDSEFKRLIKSIKKIFKFLGLNW